MKKLRFLLLSLVEGLGLIGAQAQIGYQIALLNTATGEARANEKVTVAVSLSNNAGEVFYSETKQATTNDFGVLSLSIGNADTFKDVDLTKMPFFIEVTANGVLIGKSQMLSVPVAEVAKRVVPMDVTGTWTATIIEGGNSYEYYYTFSSNGTGSYSLNPTYEHHTGPFSYDVEGNAIWVFYNNDNSLQTFHLFKNILYSSNKKYVKQ